MNAAGLLRSGLIHNLISTINLINLRMVLIIVLKRTMLGKVGNPHGRQEVNTMGNEFENWYADYENGFEDLTAKELAEMAWKEAKTRAPEWQGIREDNLPELKDDAVLIHFENGSIETCHIEDMFKPITAGFDEKGVQKYVIPAMSSIYQGNMPTHWMPLPQPPKGGEV